MAEGKMKVRVIAPDLWRESKLEVAPDTPVGELKRRALPELFAGGSFDPDSYYVEYFEKEVLDESRTLAELQVPENGVVSIRQFDVDHPPPFEG